ncbi:hypothetical protein [Streptomyces sp. NPDC001068]|uniref:hypothetical protein n=1 Tax=Streptomyces sp. NPDC001068 TaxID=3364544 RepID=UPI003699469E
MTMPAVAHATTAAPLAALLPTRMGNTWRIGPAPYGIRNNVATSRLTDGRRALIVVEEGNRVELYADRPDTFPITPDAVVDGTDPSAVAALAARALRWILPTLDAERMRADAAGCKDPADQWRRFLRLKGTHLIDVGFSLIDHGAHPVPREIPGQMARKADHMDEWGHPLAMERPDGPGLAWTAASGAEWGVWSHGCGPAYTLTYEGPMRGLYGALPVLLPPLGTHTPTDAGSAFTRHLTDRFPQLQPVDADEVEFGGYQDLHGWIALPSRAELGDVVDDDTRVCAQVGPVGADFLLAAAAHLI